MLDLFPAAILDNSILTSVLVGLWITWLFQETLGWNFTGLVVPGYLASILIIDPATGGLIVIEAGLTYALVYLLSELAPVHWPSSRLFGRDRFFALLLASVTVRLGVEAFALGRLEATLGYQLSPSLHSMGLLVMPLAANALWRTGMGRGVFRLGVPVVATWICLLLLTTFTNLSFVSFELAYEDLALDFVNSPRAYFLLLVGAWLGSVFNRSYGFDFGGIIVPGLLTVCWMFPSRVFTTLFEGFVTALIIGIVISLPVIRRANLGGGRMIVLGFTTVYLVKLSLGWIVSGGWPGTRISELFGFGYLLPTIIALRIHKHGQPFRSMVPAVGTSIVAFLVATGFGWGLMVMLPRPPIETPMNTSPQIAMSAYADSGSRPTRAEMRESTTGGEGFGALERRQGYGPAIVARLGTPGLGRAAIDIAAAVDARALLLCAPNGDACNDGREFLKAEGPTWTLMPTPAGSELRVRGRDAFGVDIAALDELVPGMVLGPAAASSTTLFLGPDALYRGAVPEKTEAPVPLLDRNSGAPVSLGELRLIRYELARLMAEWQSGSDDAANLLHELSGWVDGQVLRDRDRLGFVSDDTWVGLRREGRPVILHVQDAAQPGSLAFAQALAELLDARALVADSPPSITTARYDRNRPALAIVTGLLEAWPEAEVIELIDLRDVYDIDGEMAWFMRGEREPPELVEIIADATKLDIVPATGGLNRLPLERSDTPLAQRDFGSPHIVMFTSTRVRHRFVPYHDPLGFERKFTVGPRRFKTAAWAEQWRETIVAADSEAEWRAIATRAKRSGIELTAACYDADTCPWMIAARCGDGPCERVWIPRYAGLDDALPPLGVK